VDVERDRVPSPFSQSPASEPRSWIKRAFGISSRISAAGALAHLFTARDPGDVSPVDVSNVLDHYGVRGPAARDLLVEVFTNALAAFIADDEVSEAELDYLHRLRSALSLSDTEVESAHKRVALPRLEQAIEAAYDDNDLTDEEAARLDRLRDRLMLDPADAKALYAKYATEAAQRVLRRVTEDGMLSPWEQKMLDSLGARLGLVPNRRPGCEESILPECRRTRP